jgi:hypothetical protein
MHIKTKGEIKMVKESCNHKTKALKELARHYKKWQSSDSEKSMDSFVRVCEKYLK